MNAVLSGGVSGEEFLRGMITIPLPRGKCGFPGNRWALDLRAVEEYRVENKEEV